VREEHRVLRHINFLYSSDQNKRFVLWSFWHGECHILAYGYAESDHGGFGYDRA